MAQNLTKEIKHMIFEFKDANEYSPLVLAYLGDAIYEAYVRSHLLASGNKQVAKLHKDATSYVKAKAQSDIVNEILPLLTEEEVMIYKRGRNAHSYTKAKNADVVDYRRATGFECLIGYLFIKGDNLRTSQIIDMGIEFIEKGEK